MYIMCPVQSMAAVQSKEVRAHASRPRQQTGRRLEITCGGGGVQRKQGRQAGRCRCDMGMDKGKDKDKEMVIWVRVRRVVGWVRT